LVAIGYSPNGNIIYENNKTGERFTHQGDAYGGYQPYYGP
jgi:hypothetical protein